MATSGAMRNRAIKPLPGGCVFLLKPLLEHRLRADLPGLLGRHPSPCVIAFLPASGAHPGGCLRTHASCGLVRVRNRRVTNRRIPLVCPVAPGHPRPQNLALPGVRSSREKRSTVRPSQPAPSRRGVCRVSLSGSRLPKPLSNSRLRVKTPPVSTAASPPPDNAAIQRRPI
jgi:hypothetical protein